MNPEIKICQNCKQEFRIETEDFAFYEKMKVPPPTFCPECRLQRRLMFRNERSLYRRKCDLCGKEMLTIHSPDKERIVYCNPCWWSDKWDAAEYAMDYDPAKNFFDQFRELQKKVPFMALLNEYPTLINSDYVNHAGHLRNSYFVFNADHIENSCYLNLTNEVKECLDGYSILFTELSYENINIEKSYGVHFSEDIVSGRNIYFSKHLSGCTDCFGCINLRNKQYYIFNEPYSREEYNKKWEEFNLGSSAAIEELRKDAVTFWQKFPHRAYHGTHNVRSSGDYINNCKNVNESYLVSDGEDMKFCQWIKMKPAKDAYDYTEWGNGAERIYECITVGQGASDIRMSSAVWDHVLDVEYSMYLVSSNHMFGCLGMRKKESCILNKQYSKESFDKLRTRIIQDMNANPYIDGKGRKFPYGEFFPYDLGLYDYSESTAQEYFPLDRGAVEAHGWRWKEKEITTYQITKRANELPDHIRDVDDSILQEIIACTACGRAYRIIPQELDLLRRFGFPVPHICFECRHRARLARMNPMRFYDRACAKCGGAIRTAYPPDRPEIIYCEQCYQTEVV